MTTHDEGVTLSGKDLDGIYAECFVIDTVNLDNGERVAVDAECKVRVAGDGNQTESIAVERESELKETSQEGTTNRFPDSTVMTARSAGVPEPAKRPFPLMRVLDGVLNENEIDKQNGGHNPYGNALPRRARM